MSDLEKRKILSNAVVSLVQVGVIGIVLFVQYRYLLGVIGLEKLGVWSLVLATTAATQIANLGLSASVVKYVAQYRAREETATVSSVIQTAALSAGVFLAAALAAAYPVLKLVLRLVVAPGSLPDALVLLPYTLVAFWFLVVTGIYQAGLDGFQRTDTRGALLMGAAVLHLAACYLLVPRWGLVGLGYARILQNLLTLVASVLFLRRHLPGFPALPRRWSRPLFREMFSYGMNFQAISVLLMFCDPMTKALLSRFGGLSLVGIYEMASRLIQQLRSLVVAANQVMVPAIARLKERTPERIRAVYKTSYDLMLYLALPLYAGIAVSAPLVSRLWLGRRDPHFVLFTVILCLGWLPNTLAVPPYFSNMGLGTLKWNLFSHLSMAALNAVLAFLLGLVFDGTGVVAAWSGAMIVSAALLLGSYHRAHRLPAVDVAPAESRVLAAVCAAAFIASAVLPSLSLFRTSSIGTLALSFAAPAVPIAAAVWFHPMRRRLWSWVRHDLMSAPREALDHA